ncbi:AI-2E family transporter [Roseobacter weihaiensis]|uniref:AI-2E family transporter n=1 Tax=Roseobacter weihaiensis TaxID=2763262 RepID=UPI001D0BD264|nr:AI-2E family transporter [Roseobacter sp. H9]
MPDAAQPPNAKNTYLVQTTLTLIAAAALVWLLRTGTPVFLPLTFALVIGVVFAPLADVFSRIGAPPVVGALAVLVIVLSAFTAAVIVFYPVVAEFIQRVPVMWNEVQSALGGLKDTMENVESVQEQMVDTLDPSGAAMARTNEAIPVPKVTDILSYLPSTAAQIMIFVGILYFFLLTRLAIYRFVDRNSEFLTETVLRRAESQVSRYFLAVTAINACFGILVAIMLSALGMPNAVYWGVGAFLVNYVLYLGPIFFAFMLGVGGLVVFDGPMSFLPALLFLLMNITEGQFVTPSLVGRHMSVNPLLIFVSLVFWMWLWGPLGAIIAIPLLVWVRQVYKALQERNAEVDPDPVPVNAFGTVIDHDILGVRNGPAE